MNYSYFAAFENRLIRSGLVKKTDLFLAMADAQIETNRSHEAQAVLLPLFSKMNINALIFARPAEPYRTIIDYLASTSGDAVCPEDCETRTFLHDLPVAPALSTAPIAAKLRNRKSVIIPGVGVLAHGSVSLEQPTVTYSSVCFACFVKFFTDMLRDARAGNLDPVKRQVLTEVLSKMPPGCEFSGQLIRGPFDSEEQVTAALVEAGRQVVDLQLVDSSFGNISYLLGDFLYISQTGAFLDALTGCIDPVPLDGSSCTGMTASSELPAHLEIVKSTGCRAILHGHPKFSVILSMDCEMHGCENRGRCHAACPQNRQVCGFPVVSGEVGTGRTGLCRTVPSALAHQPGVIVYGHGVFTIDGLDFNGALAKLIDIENRCRLEYLNRIKAFI